MSESDKSKQPKEENTIKAGEDTAEELLKSTFVATSGLQIGGTPLCANLSEDTSLLAVAKEGSSVFIFRLKLHESGADADWTQGETTTLSGHQGPVYLGSFSSDGTHLLTCSRDMNIRMWNVQSASCVGFLRHIHSYIRGIAFDSPNAAFATVEDIGFATVWKTDGVKTVCKRRVYQEPALTVCIFHPNKKYVVSGSASGKVRIWNQAKGGDSVEPINLAQKSITALAFSVSGSYMIAGVADGLILFWDMHCKQVVRVLSQHKAAITSIAFARDNTRIAAGSLDAKMSVMEFGAYDMEAKASNCGPVLQVRFVSDSHLMGICVDQPEKDEAEEENK